jgi:hypothetical protein
LQRARAQLVEPIAGWRTVKREPRVPVESLVPIRHAWPLTESSV